MMRTVYLQGTLAETFRPSYKVDAHRLSDVFKCIAVNEPGFKKFLAENKDDFSVIVADQELSEESINLPLADGDVIISLVPQGAKSGGAKILAAAAIVGLTISTGGLFNPAGGWAFGSQMLGAGALSTAGQISLAIAANLALTGIQQILAPDPATDKDAPESYLFNGDQQNIVEGDPVPVLYGELMVPGTPISMELLNQAYYRNNTVQDPQGNIYIV